MKNLIITTTLLLAFVLPSFAQSPKYIPAMKKALVEMDSAKTGDELQNVSNSFERIATAEKNQWLPYYYAAYAILMKSYTDKDASHIDPAMDKADALLVNAETLAADNSEINTLKAMNTQRRMEVDQSRYITLGPKCTQYIKAAEKQDANNPRAWMFDAQMTYYTPPAFGGSKERGTDMLKKAVALFSTNKPQDELQPVWGKEYATGTLAKWSKN